jgi:hypothetical protein
VIVTFATWPWGEVKRTGATGTADPAAAAASERDYRTEIEKTRMAVGELERPPSFVHGVDAWSHELESLKHELTVLEHLENPNSNTEGAK